MREKKHTFQPGEIVGVLTGETGIVLTWHEYNRVKKSLLEGRRPGHFFAPGRCASPDYLTQVPILFKDGTFDIMRSISMKRLETVEHDQKRFFEELRKNLP